MGLENLRFQNDAYAQGSQAIANVFQKLRELDDRKAHAKELATLQKALSSKSVSSPEGQEAVNRYMANVTNYATIAQQDLINSANQIIQARRAIEQEIKARQKEAAAARAAKILGAVIPSDYQSAMAQKNDFLAKGETPEDYVAWLEIIKPPQAENLQLKAELNEKTEAQRAKNQLRLFFAQQRVQKKLNENQNYGAFVQAVEEEGGDIFAFENAYKSMRKSNVSHDVALRHAIKKATPDENIQKRIVEKGGRYSNSLAATLYNQEQNRINKMTAFDQKQSSVITAVYDKQIADTIEQITNPKSLNYRKMKQSEVELAMKNILPAIIARDGEYEANLKLDKALERFISNKETRKNIVSNIIEDIMRNSELRNEIEGLRQLYQMRYNTWGQPTSPSPAVIPNSTNPQSVAPTGNPNVTFPTQINTSALLPAIPESTTTNLQSVAPTFRLNTNVPINVSTTKSDATMVVPKDEPGYINVPKTIDTSAIRNMPILDSVKIKKPKRLY